MRSDLTKKVLVYGVLGVLAAGLGWMLTWTLVKKVEHHVWAKDKNDG